jgi:hypothetical protein
VNEHPSHLPCGTCARRPTEPTTCAA